MHTENQQLLFSKRVHNVPKSFIREILKVAANPDMVSFAGGLPNPSFFPVKELQECANRVFKQQGRHFLQYAPTEGYEPLREAICIRYQKLYDMHINPEQVLITNGSQQALDLIGKLFIDAGDKVLMERPTYLGALQCFSMFQPVFRQVNLEEDGIDMGEAEMQLKANDIKLFYSIPNFQNPTGIRYSVEKRGLLTKMLSNYPTILVEDDPYGDICFNGEQLPPLYTYLPEQTILLGTFSKSVAPGLRVGWMIAHEEIIKKATILKQATDLHSGNLAQYMLYAFLSNYNIDKHIDHIKDGYEKQKNVMMDCLKSYFPDSVHHTRPDGGMFTWLMLPKHTTARKVLQKSIEENILFVPGDTFYTSDPDMQTLRLNYSNVEETQMRKAMKTLGEIITAG